MIESLNGLCTKEITLLSDGNVQPGMPVIIKDSYTVGIPGLNGRFFGICTSVKGNYATIAISGIVTVAYTGPSLFLGYNTLASDGNGKIRLDINGDDYFLVLNIDEENSLVTILLDK